MRDENGQSKGYGFVCFRESGEAARALQSLNVKNGLYVSEAKDKETRMAELVKSTYNFKKSVQYMNLYVKGFDAMTTEEELNSYFSEYGTIKSLKIVNGTGQAFVCYCDRESAKSAKEQAPNKTIKGKKLYVTYCEPKEVR
jgi:polyadenylate-binding protein